MKKGEGVLSPSWRETSPVLSPSTLLKMSSVEGFATPILSLLGLQSFNEGWGFVVSLS